MSRPPHQQGEGRIEVDGASDHLLRDIGLMREPQASANRWLVPLAGSVWRWSRLRPVGSPASTRDNELRVAELLRVSRATIARVRFCLAVTVGSDGKASTRVVHARTPDADWGVTFMTSRASRKVAEIAATGQLTLVYQLNREGAYVALVGQAWIDDGPGTKGARWYRGLDRWFPGGPRDPDVALICLATNRIELWSWWRGVMPAPRGLRAAVLERMPEGWKVLAE
jgi:general stress protein 26/uncharacterized protein YjiS (DUF1127 family)